MITLLASMFITCSDAAWIIQGVERSDLSEAIKADLVLEIIEQTDPECDLTAALEAETRR